MKLIFSISLLVFLSACSSTTVNNDKWVNDLNYLKTELPKRHINFFKIKSQKEFNEGLEKIIKNTEKANDFSSAIQLQQLIASFGDSHTKININKFINPEQRIPVHLVWFSDGLYILHTIPKYEQLLGYRIDAINNTPVATIIDSLSTLFTNDNQAIIKSTIPKLLPMVQLLEYFGFANNNSLSLKLINNENKVLISEIKPSALTRKNRVMVKPATLALCYKNERAFFTDYFLENDDTYYLQYNRCWSKELEIKYKNGKNAGSMPSFNDFEKKVLTKLNKEQPKKLVFDLRFNSGGSSPQGSHLIEKLGNYQNKHPEIQFYVIVGRHTYSSAILNALDFKKYNNVIFVGEETGGKPNHFGEVKNFVLRNTGIQVLYSTKYFKRSDDNTNTLKPDKYISNNFSNFMKGIDPVYEWIKTINI